MSALLFSGLLSSLLVASDNVRLFYAIATYLEECNGWLKRRFTGSRGLASRVLTCSGVGSLLGCLFPEEQRRVCGPPEE